LIYPNPVANIINIQGLIPSTIELYNTSGQILERRISIGNDEQFNMTGYATGVYYFSIKNGYQNYTYKLIKN
ncbi:MAG: T9SS type A sorting domain-containing protein, partial [Eudoraea sp.]|nr:T9SS type A sorting domain-containing protein [Eudoraea sp.]